MSFLTEQKKTDTAIARLIASGEKTIVREYAVALKSIRRQLAAAYDKYTDMTYSEMAKYNRLANLEKGIFKEVNKLSGKNAVKLKAAIGDTYTQSYYRTAFNIEKEAQARLGFGQLNPNTIKKAVENPLDRVGFLQRNRANQELLKRQLSSELTQGLIKGESYPQISRRIKERMDVGATNVQRIVQTECHRVQTQGRLDSLEHAHNEGVVMGYRWVSTLDMATRDMHQDMDGVEADVVDGRPEFTLPDGTVAEGPGMTGIAEHDINCRCTVIGYVKDYEPTVRRAREMGTVPAGLNYEGYAKLKGWEY